MYRIWTMPTALEPLLNFNHHDARVAAEAFLALRQVAIAAGVFPDHETHHPHTTPGNVSCDDFCSTFEGKGYLARLGLYTSNSALAIARLEFELLRGVGSEHTSGGIHLKLEPDIDQWLMQGRPQDMPRRLRKALLADADVAHGRDLGSSMAFRVAHETFMFIRSIRK